MCNCIVSAAVYVRPDANTKVPMKELTAAISKQVQPLLLLGTSITPPWEPYCKGFNRMSLAQQGEIKLCFLFAPIWWKHDAHKATHLPFSGNPGLFAWIHKSCLPLPLDPHQLSSHPNRMTEDNISMSLYSSLIHLDSHNSYVRMLCIDFSSAFNTMMSSKLISKLSQLGISTFFCNWALDFLINRPQSVSSFHKDCVLTPFLYPSSSTPVFLLSNSIIKFADNPWQTVIWP